MSCMRACIVIAVLLLAANQTLADRRTHLRRLGAHGVLRMSRAEKARLLKRPTGQERVMCAIRTFGLKSVALSPTFLKQHTSNYRYRTKLRKNWAHAVRDQWSTGRCWLFAFESWMQSLLAKKGIYVEKLSHNFLNYHSLRWRVLASLEHIAAAERPTATLDQLIRSKGWAAVTDEGGFFDWGLAIVKRHGIVPEEAMWVDNGQGSSNAATDADNTGVVIQQLKQLIVEAAAQMDRVRPRGTSKEAKRVYRQRRQQLARRYTKQATALLESSLGKPPRRFSVMLPSGEVRSYTPRTYMRDFLRISNLDLDVVTLANDPAYGATNRIVIPDEYSALGMPAAAHVPRADEGDGAGRTGNDSQRRGGLDGRRCGLRPKPLLCRARERGRLWEPGQGPGDNVPRRLRLPAARGNEAAG